MIKTLALHPTELALFEELIHKKSGMVLKTRHDDLLSHLSELMKETESHSAMELYQLLSNDWKGGRHLTHLINTLTIGETHFFRNVPQFEALERHILPDLIERNRVTKELRIWSAGCATGEEPYSIAILLHKLIPDLATWKIHLLATDINEDALEKARVGLYGNWSFRQIPEHVMERNFVPCDKKFKILPHVTGMVTFAPLNLVAPNYPMPFNQAASMDLILCRNVFIYFDEATIGSIVKKFHSVLAGTGWLVVGHSEPSQALFGDFAPCDFPGTVVYRKTPLPGAPVVRQAVSDTSTPASVSNPANVDIWAQSTPVSSTAVPYRSPYSKPLPENGAHDPLPTCAEIETWIAERRLDAAQSALTRMLHENPNDARANFLKARIHAKRMEWDLARSSIERALAANSLDAESHFLHGQILNEQGETDAAYEACRRCAFLNPEFVLAHCLMVLLLKKIGHLPQAQKAMERVSHCLEHKTQEELILGGDGMTAGSVRGLIANWRCA